MVKLDEHSTPLKASGIDLESHLIGLLHLQRHLLTFWLAWGEFWGCGVMCFTETDSNSTVSVGGGRKSSRRKEEGLQCRRCCN